MPDQNRTHIGLAPVRPLSKNQRSSPSIANRLGSLNAFATTIQNPLIPARGSTNELRAVPVRMTRLQHSHFLLGV